MRITFICVGKLKERYWSEAVVEYEKRLTRYAQIELIEVADEPAGARLSAAQVSKVLTREGERLLTKIAPGDFVVTLCAQGKRYNSEAFAAEMDVWTQKPRVAFIIGGSHGLCDKVYARSDARVSLSDMTLPHQLARVVLFEQVYRSFKINGHETYHK